MTDPAIPDVSLASFETGSESEKRRIAADVDRICRAIGFLVITDHGVDRQVIERAWDAAREFFAQPLEEKLAARDAEPGSPRGYSAPQSESLAASLKIETPPDLKESFSSGPAAPPDLDAGVEDYDFFFGPNVWPTKPAIFERAWRDYYAAMEDLGARIMRLFAAALALDEQYFVPFHTAHLAALRGLSYPPQEDPVLPGQRPAGEHSDYGSVTILKPDPDVPGLEVRLPSGEWQAAPVITDGFLVNIGDMLANWTNDRWVSTLHRVVPNDGDQRRQSIAFFLTPNYDAEIRCIDSCLAEGEEPLYPPVSAGRYLMDKFKATI